MSEVKPDLTKRSYLVDTLAILFGISSWIGVTTVFLQLPLLVSIAPEGWSLPSYMVITIQAANIFSFAYVLFQKYSPKKFNDGHFIYVTMAVGCVAAVCMSLFYDETTNIGGRYYSVYLLIFTLMFAIVGCLSSVLFMPYMGRFREIYLVTYLLGQALNGFLSSILALIQGVGGTPECVWNNSTDTFDKYIPAPRFGPDLMFLFVFAILMLSTIAFILLNKLKVCRDQYAAGTIGLGNEYHYDQSEKEIDANVSESVRNLSTFNFVFLIAVEAVSNCLGNSVVPSIQAYLFLPYGSVTYHLAATLGAIVNPLICIGAMFISRTSIPLIRLLSVCALPMIAYIFFIASKSPQPPLQNSGLGPVLIVSTFTVFYAIINYTKLSITSIFRYQEGRSLVLVGIINQISSVGGALIAFFIVNYANAFTAYEPC